MQHILIEILSLDPVSVFAYAHLIVKCHLQYNVKVISGFDG